MFQLDPQSVVEEGDHHVSQWKFQPGPTAVCLYTRILKLIFNFRIVSRIRSRPLFPAYVKKGAATQLLAISRRRAVASQMENVRSPVRMPARSSMLSMTALQPG